jgi:hypothetical protein
MWRQIGRAALCVAVFSACSNEQSTPEDEVRALFRVAEAAAEASDSAALRAVIADDYTDEEGRDKRAIDGVIRYYILRHESIHVLTQVKSLTFPEPLKAQAVIVVATAGAPIDGAGELERMRADLHRFDVDVVREGKAGWKITRAIWRRALLADFL